MVKKFGGLEFTIRDPNPQDFDFSEMIRGARTGTITGSGGPLQKPVRGILLLIHEAEYRFEVAVCGNLFQILLTDGIDEFFVGFVTVYVY